MGGPWTGPVGVGQVDGVEIPPTPDTEGRGTRDFRWAYVKDLPEGPMRRELDDLLLGLDLSFLRRLTPKILESRRRLFGFGLGNIRDPGR